jgi:hypothetical protein
MPKRLFTTSYRRIIFLAIILISCLISPSYAVEIALQWRANTERDLDHYVVYWGKSSRQYTHSRDVPKNETKCTVDLQEGQVYFFAVTAVDVVGLESDYSDEIFFTAANLHDMDSGSQAHTDETTVSVSVDDVYGKPNHIMLAQDLNFTVDPTGWLQYALDQPPVNFTFVEDASEGKKTVYAKFRDAGLNEIGWATGEIILDRTSPVVQAISSSVTDGAYTLGATIPITITISEPVTLANGTLGVLTNTGRTFLIDVVDSSANASFVYTIQPGDTVSVLSVESLALSIGASLKDGAGNQAELTLPAGNNLADTKQIAIDTTSPWILTYPHSYIDFRTNMIHLAYSENGMQNTTSESNFRFSPSLNFKTPGINGDDIIPEGGTYRLQMAYIPADTIYTLTLSNIADVAGNGVSPAMITMNDDDNDHMADDWERSREVDDPDPDPDGDGVTNMEEFENGTEPRKLDTDGDQLPDGWELRHELEPLINDRNGDLDADGYTNLQEYRSNTRPNDNRSKPQPPRADAGPDQVVAPGETVTLDGFNSTDADDGIVSYLWHQTGGGGVTLAGVGSIQPTFIAPNVGVNGETLIFQLTVSDRGGLQSVDRCMVNVSSSNIPPTADAGPDQTVTEGATVTVVGSGSSDPDDGIASYRWSQTGGSPVTLSDPLTVNPTFVTPPVDLNGATLTFQLTAADNGGLKDSDSVSVKINDNGITDFPEHVLTMRSSTGEPVGIEQDSGGRCTSLSTVNPSTIPETSHKPENLIYGLINMRVRVYSPGGKVSITIHLPTPAPEAYKCYKYSTTDGWYDCSSNAVFSPARDQVTLTLIDGGIGDEDRVVNGVIVDPVGLGVSFTGEGGNTSTSEDGESTSAWGGGGGCFIATAAFGSNHDRYVRILSKFRDKHLLSNRVGAEIVNFYDRFSPPVADFLRDHPLARTVVRWALIPVAGAAYLALQIHPLVLVSFLILLLCTSILLVKHVWQQRDTA